MRSAVALLLPLLLLAASAFADEAKPRTITTTGSATIYVVPDEATIRFSVHTFDKELPKSKTLNDGATGEVLAFIKSAGVDAKDIQSTAASSEAVYESKVVEGVRVTGDLTGYNVTRQYGLKLRDVSKLGRIYDQLLGDSRVTLFSQSLGCSEMRKYRDQARSDAAKAAQEKATLLTGVLNAKVGSPREITESVPTPWAYSQNGFLSNSGREVGGGEAGSESAPVGQIEVKAEVIVVFDLIPNLAK